MCNIQRVKEVKAKSGRYRKKNPQNRGMVYQGAPVIRPDPVSWRSTAGDALTQTQTETFFFY